MSQNRKPFSNREKAYIIKQYANGASLARLAARYGCSDHMIKTALHNAGVAIRSLPFTAKDPPTPEEIKERAAAIQETWTKCQERQRAGVSEEPYTFPICNMIERHRRSANRGGT